MLENINEFQPQTREITPETEKESAEGFEIVKGDELNKVGQSIGGIKNRIDHDEDITDDDILQIKEAINNLTIDILGEKVLINEVKDKKGLLENIEILKEIEQGNFKNHKKLIFITDNAAESLSKHEGRLFLNGLTSLADNQAESLSKHKKWLGLDGLTSLTDNQAESLSKHEGSLFLSGLTSLTDNQAESLSKHEGNLYVSDYIEKQINEFKK